MTLPPDQFDLFKSQALREAGMARVVSNSAEFKYRFHLVIMHLPRGWIGQCEDIRKIWKWPMPHPNAWGANWAAAVKLGLLEELPERASMTGVKSHGRKTHLFRRT
jgi:hypothetical protein